MRSFMKKKRDDPVQNGTHAHHKVLLKSPLPTILLFTSCANRRGNLNFRVCSKIKIQ